MKNKVITSELGSTDWFIEQEKLIKNRRMVKYCYNQWYKAQKEDYESVPEKEKTSSIELGSGGSFLNLSIPHLIRTDVEEREGIAAVDAQSLPYSDHSLSAIFMSHVLHHIPNVRLFFKEADRTLKKGGVISLIEVAHTPLARFIFSNFHTEPYNDQVKDWEFKSTHNMDANQALSWVIFFRDKERFEKEFPNFEIEKIQYMPWLTYLLSGGVTKPQMLPTFLDYFIIYIDKFFKIFNPLCALHWHIRIRKKA